MRYITIEGKRYEWKEIRRLRREQIAAARTRSQLTLFELKHDSRPQTERSADGRYAEPLLFRD